MDKKTTQQLVDWSIEDLVEVKLKHETDFFKIRETLTRMGIPSYGKKLYQSVHIHKDNGTYYICHFKEMFGIEGRPCNLIEEDLRRRNLIISLLQEWDMLTVVNEKLIEEKLSLNYIKILPFREKQYWELIPKFRFRNPPSFNHD